MDACIDLEEAGVTMPRRPGNGTQSLKEVVTVGSIELAALHAAVLEICDRCRKGRDLSGPVSR
jgi:hypothetical protein